MTTIVADVRSGSVVCWKGEWGVLNGRTLDRWYGPRIRLNSWEVVKVLPRKQKEI